MFMLSEQKIQSESPFPEKPLHDRKMTIFEMERNETNHVGIDACWLNMSTCKSTRIILDV